MCHWQLDAGYYKALFQTMFDPGGLRGISKVFAVDRLRQHRNDRIGVRRSQKALQLGVSRELSFQAAHPRV